MAVFFLLYMRKTVTVVVNGTAGRQAGIARIRISVSVCIWAFIPPTHAV